MPADIVVVHLLLAAALFFMMNWIGAHAVVTERYYQITYFSRYDDAPAFNIAFRVLAPVVYIVIVGAVLHSGDLSRYVTALYMIVVYQQVLRWGFLVSFERRLLLRWRTQATIALATVALSVAVYRLIISNPTRLLPRFDNLANELWLLIIIFLYKLVDRVHTPAEGNRLQKERYLASRYEVLRARFGTVVQQLVPQPKLLPLVYAVLIYETFNRPTVARFLERLLPSRGRPRTYGVMQVRSHRALSDHESIRRGVACLVTDYQNHVTAVSNNRTENVTSWEYRNPGGELVHRQAAGFAARRYNIRSDYAEEVMSIHDFLVEKYYPELAEVTVGLG
jgi:hypothetical protein